MADVEQRAEAEASAKGLSGQARKSYIGGVFNKIRQAHARVVKPGKGKTFMSNLNRRNRQLARARYQEALRPHEQAVADLKRQRKQELEQLSYEKAPKSERTPTPAAPITPKPPKLPAPERQRQRAIADAIKHGAPDFPPGTLAAAQGKPAAMARPATKSFREQALQRAQLENKPAKREAPSQSKHKGAMGIYQAEYEHLANKFASDIHGQNRRETYRNAQELRKRIYDLKRESEKRFHTALDKEDAAKTPLARAAAKQEQAIAKQQIAEADELWQTVWDLGAASRNNPETTQRWLDNHSKKKVKQERLTRDNTDHDYE